MGRRRVNKCARATPPCIFHNVKNQCVPPHRSSTGHWALWDHIAGNPVRMGHGDYNFTICETEKTSARAHTVSVGGYRAAVCHIDSGTAAEQHACTCTAYCGNHMSYCDILPVCSYHRAFQTFFISLIHDADEY